MARSLLASVCLSLRCWRCLRQWSHFPLVFSPVFPPRLRLRPPVLPSCSKFSPRFFPLFKLSCTARSASLFSPSLGSAFFLLSVLLSFSGFIARECPRYPGNKVTVIAGLMAMHRWASVLFGRAKKMNSVDGLLRLGP